MAYVAGSAAWEAEQNDSCKFRMILAGVVCRNGLEFVWINAAGIAVGSKELRLARAIIVTDFSVIIEDGRSLGKWKVSRYSPQHGLFSHFCCDGSRRSGHMVDKMPNS
jgi:hypothetical protein